MSDGSNENRSCGKGSRSSALAGWGSIPTTHGLPAMVSVTLPGKVTIILISAVSGTADRRISR